jgi:hypothetical protein
MEKLSGFNRAFIAAATITAIATILSGDTSLD